jgi:Co/Zn/Cd efflux system component
MLELNDQDVREHQAVRRAVAFVALLNLAYFVVEFGVALAIGSVSLLADSADFLEDASVNLLIFVAIGWSVQARGRLGMSLAAILLLPAVAFPSTLWQKLHSPVPPAGIPLALTGAGALLVNFSCAFILARYRHHKGSITNAAFLSARNDAAANLAIIAAALVTLHLSSIWPDVIVGVGIAMMNLEAARTVWTAARRELAADASEVPR